jgi:cell division protease FtsH
MMGGRCAEELIFGTLSTGGSNDLQRATEMARKMVREFGMSERVGPMAWGNGGEVFLGDDLMHTRDYSDVTSRVIDEEVERILRDQESRALRLLREHQRGLAAIAQALIQRETIDGAEVSRLVDQAYGRPVHDQVGVPTFVNAGNGASHGDPGAFPAEAPITTGAPPPPLQSGWAAVTPKPGDN